MSGSYPTVCFLQRVGRLTPSDFSAYVVLSHVCRADSLLLPLHLAGGGGGCLLLCSLEVPRLSAASLVSFWPGFPFSRPFWASQGQGKGETSSSCRQMGDEEEMTGACRSGRWAGAMARGSGVIAATPGCPLSARAVFWGADACQGQGCQLPVLSRGWLFRPGSSLLSPFQNFPGSLTEVSLLLETLFL